MRTPRRTQNSIWEHTIVRTLRRTQNSWRESGSIKRYPCMTWGEIQDLLQIVLFLLCVASIMKQRQLKYYQIFSNGAPHFVSANVGACDDWVEISNVWKALPKILFPCNENGTISFGFKAHTLPMCLLKQRTIMIGVSIKFPYCASC